MQYYITHSSVSTVEDVHRYRERTLHLAYLLDSGGEGGRRHVVEKKIPHSIYHEVVVSVRSEKEQCMGMESEGNCFAKFILEP